VIVIDGATNLVITTVTAGDYPLALCYNPQNNKVYCANDNSGNVTVIEGATNQVITTVTARGSPCALCHNPQNNKVYCANYWGANVTVIDGASNQVLRTIGVGDGPRDFTWNPAQNRVYVANYEGSSISVLRDSMPGGIEEAMSDERGTMRPSPTIVRRVLVLGAAGSRENTGHRTELLDVSGRKVLELKPGANDVSRLSPGVYFVREETVHGRRYAGNVQKVVVTR
jgi:YVTN family beta-propeller protein